MEENFFLNSSKKYFPSESQQRREYRGKTNKEEKKIARIFDDALFNAEAALQRLESGKLP